jgi:hypothetical protein
MKQFWIPTESFLFEGKEGNQIVDAFLTLSARNGSDCSPTELEMYFRLIAFNCQKYKLIKAKQAS